MRCGKKPKSHSFKFGRKTHILRTNCIIYVILYSGLLFCPILSPEVAYSDQYTTESVRVRSSLSVPPSVSAP